MITPMPGKRLSPSVIRDHLALESGEVCGIVRQLRRMVFATAPLATEDIKFGSLTYYQSEAPFGSIGGNMCMIDVRRGKVTLSFIHGVELDDPNKLLRGKGKSKRFVPVASRDAALDPRLIALVRESAERVEPE